MSTERRSMQTHGDTLNRNCLNQVLTPRRRRLGPSVHERQRTMSSSTVLQTVQDVLTILIVTVSLSSLPYCSAETIVNGGILTNSITYKRSGSPFIIEGDLKVDKTAELTIEPGVVLQFHPRVGLDVEGILTAQGSASERIVFTKYNTEGSNMEWNSELRLVDGSNITHGRLQMNYKGKWRGVCTNYRNWTQESVHLACRKMGYLTGNFTFERIADNHTYYMLLEDPKCLGTEASILDCPGSQNVGIGNDICVNQLTAGLACYGAAPELSDNYWRGLTFFNSTIKTITIRENVSASTLEYVDIMYAGVNSTRNFTAALSASPEPPELINVRIMRNSFDGVNFTEIRTPAVIRNSEISYNRGYGINITSFIGLIDIDNMDVHHNYGEGMRARLVDKSYYFYRREETFCLRARFPIETFPLIVPGEESLSTSCERTFVTRQGKYITLRLVESRLLHPDTTASLTVYDGKSSTTSPLVATWNLLNNTLYQGITSRSNAITVVFRWKSPLACRNEFATTCTKFTLYLTSGTDVARDFSITNSRFNNNTGRGLSLENPRNMVYLYNVTVTHNTYDTGLRVLDGASDVFLKSSHFMYNDHSSINITYSGGHILLHKCRVSENYERGLTTHFLKYNKTHIERNHTVEVVQSTFEYNKGFAVFFGNYCDSGHILVNLSTFAYNMEDAVYFESCYLQQAKSTNFSVVFNDFQYNKRMVVRMTPALNVYGKLTNNTFSHNERGVLFIDNTDEYVLTREYRSLPVDYHVGSNNFVENKGWFVVNVRLSENSAVQLIKFMYNRFQRNVIVHPFPGLNPRSRGAAVFLMSSTNIILERNLFHNPNSLFEVTSHLLEPAVTLDITKNYWKYVNHQNFPDFQQIVGRLFDNAQRYDLAKFRYNPALKVEDLHTNILTTDMPDYWEPFKQGNRIGGELTERTNQLKRELELSAGEYEVVRDIIVPTDSRLVLSPGVKLNFANSVGMLIEGELQARGDKDNHVLFQLLKPKVDAHNATGSNSTNHESCVRLVNGADQYEGLVEVHINGVWGTICNRGWDMQDAAVVCQELGYSLHPGDYIPKKAMKGQSNQAILMSSVNCDKWDTTILSCKSDGQFDHSCNHDTDVYVRCKPKTWAGVRFTVQAQPSHVSFSTFTEFGLLDYARFMYFPAIQSDFHRHEMSNLNIENGVSHGLALLHGDPYNTKPLDKITSKNNLQSGILAKGPFVNIRNSHLAHNQEAGFKYDTKFTAKENAVLRSLMIGRGSQDIMAHTSGNPLIVTAHQTSFIYCSPNPVWENKSYSLRVQTDFGFRISLQILDYNPVTSEEKIVVMEGPIADDATSFKNWTIEDDAVDFPMPLSQYVVIRFIMNGLRSGRFAAIVRSVPNHTKKQPSADVTLSDTVLTQNGLGSYTIHYNNPSNEFYEIFFRFRQGKFLYNKVTMSKNVHHAMYIPSITKYHESFMPTYAELEGSARLSEITYSIQSSTIQENGIGIIGDHNHVEFSNNIWHWEVSHNRFAGNKQGGFMLELPLVGRGYSEKDKDLTWYEHKIPVSESGDNPYDPTLKYRDNFWVHNHTIFINNTIFEDNTDFDFRLAGYYANTSVVDNIFNRNKCLKSLATVAGMEKQIIVRNNTFTYNEARFVFTFDTTSHYEYFVKVSGMFERNTFKDNRISPAITTIPNQPTSGTLAVRGVENITIHRNRFVNKMQYELVADGFSSFLESYLDARYNYWGTADQFAIRELVFDFDDWNDYAMAKVYPFLTQNRFDSPVSTGGWVELSVDITKPLHGKVKSDLLLPYQSQPYVVKGDLTIMPGASLTISPGVVIEFHPNVGILNLGKLDIRGKPDNPIRLKPRIISNRVKRASGSWVNQVHTKLLRTRLVGGKLPNEGFLEFYNETASRWELTCDSQFNEKVGRAVCIHMGLDSDNVIVRYTKYYDYALFGYDKRTIKYFWRFSYHCSGNEDSLSECVERINYKLFECTQQQEYVFLRCAHNNLAKQEKYWGNIRFASPEIEERTMVGDQSQLQHIQIYGAGVLHGERVAAIQSTHLSPKVDFVTVKNCAAGAFDFIAPRSNLYIANSTIENNLGHGIDVLVLNGDSRDTVKSSFRPLNESTIPYNTYGLVHMCDGNKDIVIENRFLVYYKYSYRAASCVKVVRSKVPRKRVAVRFLQIDVFHDNFSKNAVELFNGDKFANASNLIVELLADSTEDQKMRKYETRKDMDVMSIHIHASPGKDSYGFIAEVVTLPLSPLANPNTGPNQLHTFGDLTYVNNQGSFLRYRSVGEINPNIEVVRNYVKNNGIEVLNLTASPMIDMFIQNNLRFDLTNNYIYYNKGGAMHFYTYSMTGASALTANVTNNFLDSNSFGEALHIEGTYYQKVKFAHNYIGHNNVEHRNVMLIKDVAINATWNTIFENVGAAILNISSVKEVGSYQHYHWNYFYKNEAIGRIRTTLFVRQAMQVITDNYFFNERNDFEMATSNRTRLPKLTNEFDDRVYPWVGPDGVIHHKPLPALEDTRINATENWWGSKLDVYVKGRIWDKYDDYYIVGVDYKPYHTSNASLLDGLCAPGWILHKERCFMYMGGVVPFDEARIQCKHEEGVLADSYNVFDYLRGVTMKTQANYNEFITRVWVGYTGPSSPGKCTVIRHWWLETFDCDALLPFICEKDPYPYIGLFDWVPILIAIGCIGGLILIIMLILLCWLIKTKRRSKERFERRSSVRSSIKSNRSVSNASLGSMGRRNRYAVRPPLGARSVDTKVMTISGTTLDATSTDTIDKIKYGHMNGTPASSTMDIPDSDSRYSGFFEPNELQDPYSPRLENEIANVRSRPMYDTVYQNKAYDDRSIERSRRRPPSMAMMDEIDVDKVNDTDTFSSSEMSTFKKPLSSSSESLHKDYTSQDDNRSTESWRDRRRPLQTDM